MNVDLNLLIDVINFKQSEASTVHDAEYQLTKDLSFRI